MVLVLTILLGPSMLTFLYSTSPSATFRGVCVRWMENIKIYNQTNLNGGLGLVLCGAKRRGASELKKNWSHSWWCQSVKKRQAGEGKTVVLRTRKGRDKNERKSKSKYKSASSVRPFDETRNYAGIKN